MISSFYHYYNYSNAQLHGSRVASFRGDRIHVVAAVSLVGNDPLKRMNSEC